MLVYSSYGICITPCPNFYYGVLVARSVRAGVLLLLHLLAGSGELYAYTADLLTLDLSRCPAPTACSQLSGVQTPLVGEAWEAALAGHPDRAFARYVTRGIREGFMIGFHRSRPLRSAARNMLSAWMSSRPTSIRNVPLAACSAHSRPQPWVASLRCMLTALGLSRRPTIPASGA